jgi:hypothetical protein
VLAELEGKPNPKLFREALAQFTLASQQMGELDRLMGELIEIHHQGKPDPTFAEALGKILADARGFERVSLAGRRYANVAQDTTAAPPRNPRDLAEIMAMQQADLRVLKKQLDGTIGAFRAVIPLADRHEFAALILSGRQGFGDKIQQSVDLLGTFGRFYTRSCMTTIDATMQAYPAGLTWLRDSQRKNQAR